MTRPHYVFQSTWDLPVTPSVAFESLRDIAEYPAWWPEVRTVTRVDEDRVAVLCRSALPYDLRFDLLRRVEDPEKGVLETALEGDLAGFTRWTIASHDGGSRCVFDEEVETTKRLLNALTPVARPAFRFNHWLMMRSGHRGLLRYLAVQTAN